MKNIKRSVIVYIVVSAVINTADMNLIQILIMFCNGGGMEAGSASCRVEKLLFGDML
jgi:hypothetical protein